jgi:hypothetical protein
MRNLIQEACQGPVREAVVAAGSERVAQLRGEDLRPVRLRDFQVAAKVGRRAGPKGRAGAASWRTGPAAGVLCSWPATPRLGSP